MLSIAFALALVSSGTETAPSKAVFEPLVPPAAAAPVLAAADGDSATFSYSYIEIGASRLDLDTIDDEADAYYGKASLGLLGFLYVFGGYENQSVDFQNADTDVWSLGVGAHFPLSSNFDVHGDVAWLYNELDSDVLDESSSGALVRIVGRWMVLRGSGAQLELDGGALWYSLDDSLMSEDDSAGFELGARVHFLRALSVGAVYTAFDKDDSAAINARFSF
jgi:hypothetical protein